MRGSLTWHTRWTVFPICWICITYPSGKEPPKKSLEREGILKKLFRRSTNLLCITFKVHIRLLVWCKGQHFFKINSYQSHLGVKQRSFPARKTALLRFFFKCSDAHVTSSFYVFILNTLLLYFIFDAQVTKTIFCALFQTNATYTPLVRSIVCSSCRYNCKPQDIFWVRWRFLSKSSTVMYFFLKPCAPFVKQKHFKFFI